MKVFKFGGASVKDADALINVASILLSNLNDNVFVVVSAMGKTTNALEQFVTELYAKNSTAEAILDSIKQYHFDIIKRLFENKKHPVYEDVYNHFVELEWAAEDVLSQEYNYAYDQIVSIGEMLSSKILSHYLNNSSVNNTWLDARDIIRTDNRYREGNVNWNVSEELYQKKFVDCFDKEYKCFVTQGFIGGTSENFTTTLGREGSDYTAAIIAYLSDAQSVTIWKDVPGVLNADPKKFPEAKLLNRLSYYDAVELTYYGASVIHPKTIKPLQNKSIPLFVKSFLKPFEVGTLIDNTDIALSLPCFIHKTEQILISISVKDFSFIAEKHLSHIYSLMAQFGVKVNMMQNSALSLSVCVDCQPDTLKLIEELKQCYFIKYNTSLCLYTIRHYHADAIAQIAKGRQIILEQRSRNTIQLVVKS